MKLNKIIIYAVSGLFALSLFFFLIVMAYTSINSVTGAGIKEKLAEFEKKAAEAAKMEANQRQWRNIDKVIHKFNKQYMFNMEQLSAFRSQLPGLFAKNNLQMMPQKKIGYTYKDLFKKSITRINIGFILIGKYVDFKKFIHQVTREKYNDKMVLLRRIQLTKRDQGNLEGEITMEVYLAR